MYVRLQQPDEENDMFHFVKMRMMRFVGGQFLGRHRLQLNRFLPLGYTLLEEYRSVSVSPKPASNISCGPRIRYAATLLLGLLLATEAHILKPSGADFSFLAVLVPQTR